MSRTQTERRSIARENASQTRPDQTRVLVTALCGVRGSNSIHLTVTYATNLAALPFPAMDGMTIGGGL